MPSLRFTKMMLLAALVTGLASCGRGNGFVLLDDPTQEPPQIGAPASSNADTSDEVSGSPTDQTGTGAREAILEKYSYVDPGHLIQDKHLEAALVYFETNKAKVKNQNYISVIDFSKPSTQKRFFVIDLKTGLVWAIHTAHGKGSDANHDSYAEKFSNVPGSNASSLGIYVTAETYTGEHGYSLRLDGKSATNSNVRARSIVVHGADYVEEANVTQGRSWGCPAVSMAVRTELIEKIKNGSVIYAGI